MASWLPRSVTMESVVTREAVDHGGRAGPMVDVIAEEHDLGPLQERACQVSFDMPQEIVEPIREAVDVADRVDAPAGWERRGSAARRAAEQRPEAVKEVHRSGASQCCGIRSHLGTGAACRSLHSPIAFGLALV